MPDPAAVMHEIRSRVLEGGESASNQAPPAAPRGERPEPAVMRPLAAELAGAVSQLNELFVLDGDPPLRSHRPSRAWLIRPLKRALGKLLKWYVRPIAVHQTTVNAQNVRAWNALVATELPRLRESLAALDARLARLETTLAESDQSRSGDRAG